MTIQEQIDQLKSRLSDMSLDIKSIEEQQNQITDTSKKVKPTRYYPNGAYMDEPEEATEIWFINPSGVYSDDWSATPTDGEYLKYANCFPTEEAAEKELERQRLTAKMYRDMRDERINGDWVADWGNKEESKWRPCLWVDGTTNYGSSIKDAHCFYYKNETFIEDLKALGWTEEELKIVWCLV